MTGWLSVHSLTGRDWTADDTAALAAATTRVHTTLDAAP